MNRKNICRILGTLSSILIIAAVFLPYVTSGQYSMSLWEGYESSESLYLPIMIIVFGVIGVICFALNIKTEFAYMSSGAILFFAIIKTIEAINQDGFGMLSLGYYFLVIGSILIGIIAFISNLKIKVEKESVQKVENITVQTSMLDQIDKLYDDQTSDQNINPTIQQLDSVVQPIQPIPVQPIAMPTSVQEPVPVQPMAMPTSIQEPVPVQPMAMPTSIQEPIPVQPMAMATSVQPIAMPTSIQESIPVQPVSMPDQQSVVPQNPVVQEFTVNNIPSQTPIQTSQPNSVLQQFNTPQNLVEQKNTSQPVSQMQPLESAPIVETSNESNPVVQEFMNPGVSHTPTNNTANSSGVDIFGQPLN